MVEQTTNVEGPGAEQGSSSSEKTEEWRDEAEISPLPFWSGVRDDLIAQVPPEQRGMSIREWAWLAAKVSAISPGFKVTLLYRFNHVLVNRAGRTGRVAAGVINRITHFVYGASIAPRARIHGGLVLPHPQGIIIGSQVVIGPRTWLFQNVTMGATYGKAGQPSVGSDCRIHAGAVVGGPVKLGDRVVVSPNSFVQRSVPSCSLAVGVPANIYPRFSKPKS